MTKPRPKTGEARKTRQPLKIDRLPVAMHDRILAERRKRCRSWEEIEALSPKFDEWKEVDAKAKALFPGLRIPRENLRRWYDLRIEQREREVQHEAARAREVAAALTKQSFEDLPEAVKNLLGEKLFILTRNTDSDVAVIKAASEVGWLLAEMKKQELNQQKVKLESKRIALLEEKLKTVNEKTKGLKSDIAKAKLTPDQMQQRLDEIYGISA